MNEIFNIPSVSGNEEKMKEYIIGEIKDFCDEYYIDNFGNLIVKLNGNDETVHINVPIDESGFMVTHKEENGRLRIALIGNVKAADAVGRKVICVQKDIPGIILSEKPLNDELKYNDLYVEAADGIEIGDILAFNENPVSINGCIFGFAAARKAGIAAAVSAVKAAYKNNSKTVYFTFTIEDSIGFKGARIVSNNIKADKAIIIVPSGKQEELTKTEFKKGILIRIKDNIMISDKKLRLELEELLREKNIPYQLEIAKSGITNEELMYNGGGAKAVVLGIFAQNAGSAYECIFEEDIKNIRLALLNIL